MTLPDQIINLITPAVTSAGFYLEDVELISAGRSKVITCIVDGDEPLNLDQVTVVTKAISALLDEATFLDETPFTLEVTSPGVDRPLTLPRHWRKNHDRLVKITLVDGEVLAGRISASDELSVTLTDPKSNESVTNFADIKRATVEIEFNRKVDKAVSEEQE